MSTEAAVRDRHRDQADVVVGGHVGMIRCSCGITRFDPDDDCPAMERELDELLEVTAAST